MFLFGQESNHNKESTAKLTIKIRVEVPHNTLGKTPDSKMKVILEKRGVNDIDKQKDKDFQYDASKSFNEISFDSVAHGKYKLYIVFKKFEIRYIKPELISISRDTTVIVKSSKSTYQIKIAAYKDKITAYQDTTQTEPFSAYLAYDNRFKSEDASRYYFDNTDPIQGILTISLLDRKKCFFMLSKQKNEPPFTRRDYISKRTFLRKPYEVLYAETEPFGYIRINRVHQ